ncbi:hypothetical protein BZG36_00849 [Bifiguratus adelaidae]|uniref:Ras-GAP domain-containing protein n=1 Tax=Bifiguratus adelaidae TaxID=1938954 RepID=A0A261Y6X6_9FUNG|nr:hypothetical protein BZG36_00849 [Bifiguratus adelaidae]
MSSTPTSNHDNSPKISLSQVTTNNSISLPDDTLLISNLVNRISTRLPCNVNNRPSKSFQDSRDTRVTANLSSVSFENDLVVKQTAGALVDLAEHRITPITRSLLNVLDGISTNLHAGLDDRDLDELHQSQWFILRLLYDCMQRRWQKYLDHSRHSSNTPTNGSDEGANVNARSEKPSPADRQGSPQSPIPTRSTTSSRTEAEGSITWQGCRDPPPLENQLAAHMFSTVSRFISSALLRDDLLMNTGCWRPLSKTAMKATTNLSTKNEEKPTSNGKDTLSPETKNTRDHMPYLWSVQQEIHLAACGLLNILSASNWPVLFQHFKSRLSVLSGTPTGGKSASSDGSGTGGSTSNIAIVKPKYPGGPSGPDYDLKGATGNDAETSIDLGMEVKFLEVAALDGKRLSAVLFELSISFLHLKRPAQSQLAATLRKTIWQWIETYPSEFAKLSQSGKRLEGNPEVLFDQCTTLADTPKRRAILWPLQSLLLCLCPDILMGIVFRDGRATQNKKKASFLDALKLSLKASRSADIATACYVEICRAATYDAPTEKSALRHIIPDICDELRDRLFDIKLIGGKQDTAYAELVDQTMLTHCFTSLYRLYPAKTGKTLISMCADPKAPIIFKEALVRSCLQLAIEGDLGLPWIPSVTAFYQSAARPIRAMLVNCMARERVNADITSLPSNSSSMSTGAAQLALSAVAKTTKMAIGADKRGTKLDIGTRYVELQLSLLMLFCMDPSLVIIGEQTSTHVDEVAQCIANITQCLKSSSPSIRRPAAECLRRLHQDTYIVQWGEPHTMMETFWKTSSQVLLTIARQILDTKKRDDTIKTLLELLRSLLVQRNQFLSWHLDQVELGTNVRERLAASVAMEIALLVVLCSSDPEICSLSLACFAQLCREAEITDEVNAPESSQLSIIQNIHVYRELVSSGPTLATGQKALQKRIRKLRMSINKETPGNLAAWEEVWKRWKALTFSMIKSEEVNKEEGDRRNTTQERLRSSNGPQRSNAQVSTRQFMDGDLFLDWQNYTGFLASLGGSYLPPAHGSHSEHRSRNSVYGATPDSHAEPTATPHEQMVEKFVQEMAEMLVHDELLLREVTKDILGSDLSPNLFGVLFRHLESIVNTFSPREGEVVCSPMNTTFVDQITSVLKLILDRLTDQDGMLINVDIGSLIFSLVRYLDHLGVTPPALRIKIKTCQLCENLMAKKDIIMMGQEIRLRNQLLETITEWTSDFSLRPESQNAYVAGDNLNEKYHRDLDQACLRSLISILDHLPLQPAKDVREADVLSARSQLFYKYFTFFLKLLSRCKVYEAIERGPQAKKPNQDLQLLLHKSKESVKDLGPLKEYTILALSNLLSANIDAGLKYSLSMGYHEDSKTRTAFMQVLTNILNQGTEFENLSENAVSERHDKLMDLIVNGDVRIAISLCDHCSLHDQENVIKLVLSCFEARHQTLRLLKALIEREVADTDNKAELFRQTTVTTRMLSIVAKMYGTPYLQETLQPVMLASLNKEPSGRAYEMDPTKLDNKDDLVRNTQNVQNTAKSYLEAIFASVPQLPSQKVPRCEIHRPELLQHAQINKEFRRGQLLITKVIGNLFNNVLFGSKESFMEVLNDFLTENIYLLTQFLHEISEVPPGTETVAIDLLVEPDPVALHRFLYACQDKIARDIATGRFSYGNDLDDLQILKQSHDKLARLMAHLGKPTGEIRPEPVLPKLSAGSTTQVYNEFMRRNQHRSVESIKSKGIVYVRGTSKAGRPVFYFIARRVTQDVDYDLLIYYMLILLDKHQSKSVDLILDYTLFDASHQMPRQWLGLLYRLFPRPLSIGNCIIFNPNSEFRRYARKSYRIAVWRVAKRCIFTSTLAELHDYIPPADTFLPASTQALETAPSSVFFPVTRYSQLKTHYQVTIKVSNDYVQLISVRRQELMMGMNAIINDIFHVSQIDEASLSTASRSEDGKEFSIKINNGGSILCASQNAEAVIMAIKQSLSRRQTAKPTDVAADAISPGDVPGRLLNMALLNLGSDDVGLRLASYNLLCALSCSFHFEVGNQLLNAKDLCIPANNTSFVISMSEKLAQTESHLTLELLNECLSGFAKSSTPQKHLCLDYMAPWLANLGRFARDISDNGKDAARAFDVVRQLINLTVEYNALYGVVQSKVWHKLSYVDDAAAMLLETFVAYMVEKGVGSTEAEIVADTAATLSSNAIRGKLIAQLRKNVQKLHTILRHLSDETTRLSFGLTRRNTNAFTISAETLADLDDSISLSTLESTVHTVLDILEYASVSAGKDESIVWSKVETLKLSTDVANRWRARWMSLVASTAFQFNPAIQPRAFVVLGCLAQEEVDDDILYQILVALRGALAIFNESDAGLIISILMCLRNIVPNVPEDSRYIRQLFWLSIALLQMGQLVIFPAAVELLQAVLRAMDNADAFADESLATVLLEAREPLTSVSRRLDENCGVNFESHFSFAVAATLLKGLKQSNTKVATSAAFETFLEIECKHPLEHQLRFHSGGASISARTLGYLVSILPLALKNGTAKQVLRLAGVYDVDIEANDTTSFVAIMDRFDIPDENTALVLISLMLTMLNSADDEQERLFLYGLLAEAAMALPESFSLAYDTLLPKLNQVLANSDNLSMIESVNSIIYSICTKPIKETTNHERMLKSQHILARVTTAAPRLLSRLAVGGVSALLGAGLVYGLLDTPPNASLADDTLDISIKLDQLPITRALRSRKDTFEVKPDSWTTAEQLEHSLTGKTLRGKGLITVRPLMFYKTDHKECWMIFHLGERVCGHAGIVHGGLLATLLDEGSGMLAIPNLPQNTGFTANLTVNYLAPTPVESFLVLHAKLEKTEGRKAIVRAWIERAYETLEEYGPVVPGGEVDLEAGRAGRLVEATGLFVSPKYKMPAVIQLDRAKS